MLINVDTGAEQAVLERVKSVPQVIDARAVYGAYDIICLIEVATITELKVVIKDKLRQIDQVRSTFTMLQM